MDRVSNSAMSKINPEQGGSPTRYLAFLRNEKEPFETKKPSLDLGTLVHNKVLEPEKYTMVTLKMPSDNVVEIVKKIFDMNFATFGWSKELRDTQLSEHEKEMKTFAKELKFGQSWKEETLIDKILAGVEYYEFLKESDTKMLVDEDMYAKASRCEVELKVDENIQFLLYDTNDDDDYITLNEIDVLWEEEIGGETIKMKAKIDRMLIKPKENKFAIIDVKTSSKPLSLFGNAIERYRYHRQLAFYRRAAFKYLEQNYPGETFQFHEAYITAVETTGFFESGLYKIPEEMLQKGNEEIEAILQRIVWHHKNGWTKPKEYIENDGFFIAKFME